MTDFSGQATPKTANRKPRATSPGVTRWAAAVTAALGAVAALTLVLFLALSHWQPVVRAAQGPQATAERAFSNGAFVGSPIDAHTRTSTVGG